MQYGSFAIVLFVLNWAPAVTALPLEESTASLGSLPATLLARESPKLGINCRGSARCYGHSSIYDLQQYLPNVDNKTTYASGQQVVCRPSVGFYGQFHTHGGLCVFPQKLQGNETVSGQEVKDAVQRIFDHKCKACGSTPIYSGEITINWVREACGWGKCDYSPSAGKD
ncbi:hypothetical protein BDU57DRAFT_524124 [Ampelomyces quisqualis]|uniref:Killer toxin Kp4 domain-containing protein n=1 Tax=Ampelomyces quisqualis TaxID=50730 RepID=A0A6A5Q9T9_AMPQU|nr:hypothetical protein BDU57DRAFT_524124 [Ampelomyces quisqualis]